VTGCVELSGFVKVISGQSLVLIGVSLVILIVCHASDRYLKFYTLVSYITSLKVAQAENRNTHASSTTLLAPLMTVCIRSIHSVYKC
jgi:hypothetical protein